MRLGVDESWLVFEVMEFADDSVSELEDDEELRICDAWKVDPECVFNVLDAFILQYYVEFDRNTTRVNRLSSTCVGSLKKATPPVAASPLEARPPVQPTEGSSASTPMALSQ
ncbi:hypothetical protein Tco_1127651 [Tanacetum coccineum]